MAGNTSLNAAKAARKDEFYTQLSDIENELKHYRKHFAGKTVLCNCDDPHESNFFRYFALNFNRLKLKKLIATSYDGSPIAGTQLDLFGDAETGSARAYKAVVTTVRDADGDGDIDMLDVAELFRQGANSIEELAGNGDFRSEECIEMLRQADIVVTNPPFSLFREYVAQLVEHGEKFLVIGPQNALKYMEIFPLIQANKIWLGYGFGDMAFRVPDYFEPKQTRYWQDESGQKWRSMGNMAWYTNLDISKRHEELVLVRRYRPEDYPRYVNYDAIEVGKVADIPCDYAGEMGVPITFMDKHNPEQFEIVGLGHGNLGVEMGLAPYDRALKARNKALRDGDLFYMKGDYPKVPYTRSSFVTCTPRSPENENRAEDGSRARALRRLPQQRRRGRRGRLRRAPEHPPAVPARVRLQGQAA